MKRRVNYLKTFIFISLIAVLLWGSTIFITPFIAETFFPYENRKPPSLGEIGDIFGVINSIFSGLALTGVIITILLQREGLEEQKHELHETRKEFQITRVTNLIYNQIKRIDDNIDKIKVVHPTSIENLDFDNYFGRQGLHFLGNLLNLFDRKWNELNAQYSKHSSHVVDEMGLMLSGHISDNQSIMKIIEIINDSMRLISKIMENDEISSDDKSELIDILVVA